MMKRWYPLYWHPFSWITESELDKRPRLEPPILYYASKLRNDIFQMRRWLYAYGPEGMYPDNWGKFITWTRSTRSLAQYLLNKKNQMTDSTELTRLCQSMGEVLQIKEEYLGTREARKNHFHTLIRSIDDQRALLSRTSRSLNMSEQRKIRIQRTKIPLGHRTGYRPELADLENKILSKLGKDLADSLQAEYLCRGDPSSIVILSSDTVSETIITKLLSLLPEDPDKDLFIWVVFQEELPFFLHESPADYKPGTFSLTQPRELFRGEDVFDHVNIPVKRSALSCLNALMPMVRLYSFFTRDAYGECEPRGLDEWIDEWYYMSSILQALIEDGDMPQERLHRIVKAYREGSLPRPRTIQEGMLNIETKLQELNQTIGP
jgi:hypothetical protein